MNNRKFTPIKWLVAGCCITALTTACSQQFYNRQQANTLSQSKSYPNLVEIYADNLQPMPDSLHTIVALTPMAGANVDSLFRGGDKFVIQYPNDLTQALPAGIDVVYINADYATSAIDDCSLLKETISKDNIKIMIDGSIKNIEKFCKANFSIYNPGAAIMVYENIPPDSSPERDIPFGASATMAYGKAYNAISYNMLIESIFDFSVNDKQTVEDFKKAFEYKYDPKSPKTIARIAKLNELQKQKRQELKLVIPPPVVPEATTLFVANNGNSVSDLLTGESPIKMPSSMAKVVAPMSKDPSPYCDWNLWNHKYFDDTWTNNDFIHHTEHDAKYERGKYVTVSGNSADKGTHLFNEKDFESKGFWVGDYIQSGWHSGSWKTWTVRRFNCVDDAGYFSMKVEETWTDKVRLDNPGDKNVLTGRWVRFDTRTSKSGYLDFGISSNYTKSFGLTREHGLGLGVGGDIMGFSVEQNYEQSWSKSKSQDVTITKSTNNEFWFGRCMMKVSNPIYGRIEAWTKTKYASASINMRLRMIYAEQGGKRRIKAIQYQISDPDLMPNYKGHMRHADSYWSKAVWKRTALWSSPPITNFKDCGKPRKR